MVSLPLNGFKRDEIYTFLGGLFVNCGYVLYFFWIAKCNFEIEKPSDPLFIILFIFGWLFSTVIINIINEILRQIQNGFWILVFRIKEFIKNKKEKKSTPEEKQKNNEKTYYPIERFDGLLLANHISNVIAGGFLILLVPLALIPLTVSPPFEILFLPLLIIILINTCIGVITRKEIVQIQRYRENYLIYNFDKHTLLEAEQFFKEGLQKRQNDYLESISRDS